MGWNEWSCSVTEQYRPRNWRGRLYIKYTQCGQNYAPTDSISGRYPSLRLRSNLRISSTLVAFAMAVLTLSASSLDMNRAAFNVDAAPRGSSANRAAFVACVDTVVEIVVAKAVGSLSAVRKSDFPACLS